jgi:HAD superfamily hydrolase (TIGR01549 family)
MIKAIIFDLDDTLYPEIEYVKSGFNAIAEFFCDKELSEKLWNLFVQDKNNVYQRYGFSKEECDKCVEIYRSHKPNIRLSNEIKEVLKSLKSKEYKLGIITDGRPKGQWNKIYALGLEKIIDKIIVTDELGGVEYRKPNPTAFKLIKEHFNLEYDEMLYIGDNPIKDFKAPQQLGIKYCHFHNKNGLYRDEKVGGVSDESTEDITEYLVQFI